MNNGIVCYYDREQSVKYTECLLHQRKCNGSFSVEEFRKVSKLKKAEQVKRRERSRFIAKLRAELVATEGKLNDINNNIAELEDRSSRILKREI